MEGYVPQHLMCQRVGCMLLHVSQASQQPSPLVPHWLFPTGGRQLCGNGVPARCGRGGADCG